MNSLIEDFIADAVHRYQIITQTTPEGLVIKCLDSNQAVIAVRKISSSQLKNHLLLKAVIHDLRAQLRL